MIPRKSNVLVTVRDLDGQVIGISSGKNLIVTTGLDYVRDFLGGGELRADTMAVGTGTTDPVLADVALETQVFSRTIDRRVDEAAKITFQILLDFGDANGNVISEVGLFQNAILIARALLTPTVSKVFGKQLTIAHEISISNG